VAVAGGGPGPSRIVVVGEVDMSNSDEVGRRIVEEVGHLGGEPVLDLSEVAYLDTSGVRLVADLGRRLGPGLTVVAPAGSVAREVLDITELTGRLTVVESAE
jgi:anti-anti-sigma factor